jgi:small GTP-binding protein
VSFCREISWSSTTSISLQLWDVAGHERFGTMTRVYYRYAIAAIIVFDVTRPATFEAVLKWRDDVNSKVVLPNGEQIPILLLANKCDLQDVDGGDTLRVLVRSCCDRFIRRKVGSVREGKQYDWMVCNFCAGLLCRASRMGLSDMLVFKRTM